MLSASLWSRCGCVLFLCALGCDSNAPARSGRFAGADSAAVAQTYIREMIFVGQRQGLPLVAPLAFRTIDTGRTRGREVRGWLAHGPRWESFLDERWSGAPTGSAWTIVPHGDLEVAAGGPGEIEALWFERSGRSLRLEIDGVLGEWSRGPTARIHLFAATARVGGEPTRGAVVELLRLRRVREDDPGPTSQLLLTSGDSLTLLLVSGPGRDAAEPQSLAWLRNGDGTREWSDLRLEARGGKALQEARREIPRSWILSVPDAGLRGHVWALAYAAELGPERAGRRGVEVRYTVTGWIEIGGRRTRVVGLTRYSIE